MSLPKRLTAQYLTQLELLAAARLDIASIAAILDCTEEEFRERRKTDAKFNSALLRGKAMATKNCASIVLMAAQGTLTSTGNPVSHQQLEAAKFYLEHHAESWMEQK